MIDPKVFLHTKIDNNTIQLTEILGCGSHGVVYLGQYKNTTRYYAVKCVADTSMSDNEIHMHSILSGHPNILSLEKVVKERKHLFIIMQYATHGDLFDMMKRRRCLDVRNLYLQILDAVHHCHYNFIAHRDLKPENILIMANQRVKLADFGLSTSDAISTEYYHGTSTYFSPECQDILFYARSKRHPNQNGDPVTKEDKNKDGKITSSTHKEPQQEEEEDIVGYDTFANDIWSLGVILVALVFGRHPWLKANLKDAGFASYVSSPHTFFKRNFPSISDPFNSLLQHIFCLDPERRITLLELKKKIIKCPFVSHITATPLPPIPDTKVPQKTILAYTKCFTDQLEDEKEKEDKEDGTSEDDEEDSDASLVATPANASPVLNIKEDI